MSYGFHDRQEPWPSTALVPAQPDYFGCGTANCRAFCDNAFSRLYLLPAPRGGAAIHWQLNPAMAIPYPNSVQLQVGYGGSPTSHDWEDVGLPVVDACFAVDPEPRNAGFVNRASYRLKLLAGSSVWYSEPVGLLHSLTFRDQALAREAIRRRRLAYRVSNAPMGWLLKQNLQGPECVECVDRITQETMDENCQTCLGTGRQCPYYYPVPCVHAFVAPRPHLTRNMGDGRGPTSDRMFDAEMINVPLVDSDDVWVSSVTHDRFRIGRIRPIQAFGGITVAVQVELAQIPPGDVIYRLAIPDTLDDILE